MNQQGADDCLDAICTKVEECLVRRFGRDLSVLDHARGLGQDSGLQKMHWRETWGGD